MTTLTHHSFTDLNKLPISVQLSSYTADFLYWGFFPAEVWRNYLHSHSYFEICYAHQGQGTYRICGQDLPVQKGDIFVAKPGEPHEIISSVDDPLGIYFWSYTLAPSQNTEQPQQQDIDQLIQFFGQTQSWIRQETTNIPLLLELMTNEIKSRSPGYTTKIHSMASSLLIDTARAMVDQTIQPFPLPESENETVDKILRYLQDNFHRPLQVRDVAAQLHMSERHTSRIFKETTGTSILKYLVQMRISIAKQRLLDQSLPISEIGYSIGYSDAHHFSTLFRKHTAMTPTEFRNKNGTHFFS